MAESEQKPRILIVEDHPIIAELVETRLRIEGMEPIKCAGGREALDIIGTRPLDAVILDIMMPDVDGYEVLRYIRSQPGTRSLPGIFLTVRATLNGSVEGLFLLDTGATYCVISQSIARRLGLRASGERTALVTANGAVSAPLVTIRYFDLGSNRARDVKTVVHDSVAPPLDGIVGLSYLNHFAYVIDVRQRVVRLRPGE